jgi:hypothetical protein
MSIWDPEVLITPVPADSSRSIPSYLRVDVSGSPPDGGLRQMMASSGLNTQITGTVYQNLLLNLSGLAAFGVPTDTDWMTKEWFAELAVTGVERAVVVVTANVHQWVFGPSSRVVVANSGTPQVQYLPCSWYADEFFASGRHWKQAEGEWMGQALAWFAQSGSTGAGAGS